MQKSVIDNFKECRHSEEKRAFSGTFTTIEVFEAREQAYKIIQVHEVWYFVHSSVVLFREYVHYFLRTKQESSGWPIWVQTPKDQGKYMNDHLQHEGIYLRVDKVKNK